MSLGSVSGFQQPVCPSCGATQESAGSTVCEQCGADLVRSGARSPSSYSQPVQRSSSRPRFRAFPRLKVPRLLKRGPVVLLLAAVLFVGLSFVPEVSARVPIMKQIATSAKKAVKRARTLGWLPSPKAKAPTRRSSSPAATARKSAPQPGATLLLRVESTPAGATVQLDSRIVGKTPVTLKVAPGAHKVTFIRKGYTTVTRSVTMKPGKAGQLQVALTEEGSAPKRAAPQPVRKPAAVVKPVPTAKKPAPTAKKPAPAAPVSGRMLDTGTRAPAFALKDPSGSFHRLSDFRNRQVVVLFLWTLDSQSMRLVQDLDGRVRGAGQSLAGLVVVVNGDRAAVQKFATSARVQVPLVIGDDQTARAYGIPKSTNVAYVVSEGGLIAQRQVKTIQLSSLFTQEQKEGR